MKKVLISLISTAAIVTCALWLYSCKTEKLTKDDVDEVIVEDPSGNYIDQAGYDQLIQIYADNNGDDTSDFSARLYEIFAEIEDTDGYRPILKLDSVQVKPVNKIVYLDNTASMKGYFERGKGSKSDVSGFVSILTTLKDIAGGPETQAYYIDNKGFKAATLGNMIETINSKQMKSYDAYLMNAFLDSIVTRTIGDTVCDNMSFFVTDAIMSGTNDEIKINPKNNIDQAKHLSSKISDVLKKLKDKNYGVALIRLNVLYDGVYINYCNNQFPTKAVTIADQRPLFIMAIGPAAEILSLEKQIKENKVFEDPEMLIAATMPGKPNISIGNNNNNDAKIDREDDIFTVECNQDKPTVNLMFSFANMPEYMRNEETASEAIECKLNGKVLDLSKAEYDEKLDNLIYSLTLNDTNYTVEVRVKNVLPAWVVKYSSHDDEDIKNQLDQTFNLNWLTKGLINGIYNAPAGGNYLTKTATYTITKE